MCRARLDPDEGVVAKCLCPPGAARSEGSSRCDVRFVPGSQGAQAGPSSSCLNGYMDGNETGTDCGGSCDRGCSSGFGCRTAGDCGAGLVCVEGAFAQRASDDVSVTQYASYAGTRTSARSVCVRPALASVSSGSAVPRLALRLSGLLLEGVSSNHVRDSDVIAGLEAALNASSNASEAVRSAVFTGPRAVHVVAVDDAGSPGAVANGKSFNASDSDTWAVAIDAVVLTKTGTDVTLASAAADGLRGFITGAGMGDTGFTLALAGFEPEIAGLATLHTQYLQIDVSTIDTGMILGPLPTASPEAQPSPSSSPSTAASSPSSSPLPAGASPSPSTSPDADTSTQPAATPSPSSSPAAFVPPEPEDECDGIQCGDGAVCASSSLVSGRRFRCYCGAAQIVDQSTGLCVSASSVLPTCMDGAKNGDEADIDCGGVCGPRTCKEGQQCLTTDDCARGTVCRLSDRVCGPATKPAGIAVEFRGLRLDGVTRTLFLEQMADAFKQSLVQGTGASSATILGV